MAVTGSDPAFGEERRLRIVEIVNARGRVRVGELSREIDASEPTVRKDLALLERAGLLRRTHGGALAVQPSTEPDFSDRLQRDSEAKTSIAQRCNELLEGVDSAYFDSGTTVLRIAELLTRRNLSVLTNGIATAAALAEKPLVRHTLLGGALRPAGGSVSGALALENLLQFAVHTAFIGVTGMTGSGITVADHSEAQLKAAVLKRSRRVIVPMDASKVGVMDFAAVAGLDAIDVVVTHGATEELRRMCDDHGVDLVDAQIR